MRADRVLSVLLILQRRGRVSARALAEELEVSVATARRDLAALSSAGIPVYPVAGRGGGWELLGGYRTELTGLNDDEVRSVFALFGGRGDDRTRTALRKLLHAVPAPQRERADAAVERTVIDERSWGRRQRDRPAALSELMDATLDRESLLLDYRPWNRATRPMRIDPLGVVEKSGVWYVIAARADGLRTLRVDRVQAVEHTGESFAAPEGFDLRSHWEREQDRISELRLTASARVRGPADVVRRLERDLGRAGVQLDPVAPGTAAVGSGPADSSPAGDSSPAADSSPGVANRGSAVAPDQVGLDLADPADGRWMRTATVRAESEERIAAVLAGAGGRIEVLGPASVRTRLAELGAALVRRHSSP